MKRFTAYCNVKETVPGSQLRERERERDTLSSIMFSKEPDRDMFWKGRNEHKALSQSQQSVSCKLCVTEDGTAI